MSAFGGMLRRNRKRAGLGLRELARLLDTDPSYICHMEKGRKIPTLPTMVVLAAALGANAEKLAAAAIRDIQEGRDA